MAVFRGIELGEDWREFGVNLQLGFAHLLVKRLDLLMQGLALVCRRALELLFQFVLLSFQAGIRGEYLLFGALDLGPLGIGQDRLMTLMLARTGRLGGGGGEGCRRAGEAKRESHQSNPVKGE